MSWMWLLAILEMGVLVPISILAMGSAMSAVARARNRRP